MKEITQALRTEAEGKIEAIASLMISQGMDSGKVQGALVKYVKKKIDDFYFVQREEDRSIGRIIPRIFAQLEGMKFEEKADSKAEKSFYLILQKAEIPFRFQVKIGRYRVDYLIADNLIFEGDGPHHKNQKDYDVNRDKYLEKMGYDVMRMEWNLVSIMREQVISVIKEKIKEY